jgi:hypothetical protein
MTDHMTIVRVVNWCLIEAVVNCCVLTDLFCRDKLERGLHKKGIYVIQLQGHIFFGNIQQVTYALHIVQNNIEIITFIRNDCDVVS